VKKFLIVLLAVLALSASASANVDITLFGVAADSSASLSGINDGSGNALTFPNNGFGLGGGAMFTFMLSPMVGIDVGGMYFQRKFTYTDGGTASGSTSASYLEVPVGLKFTLARIIGLRVGAFVADAVSQVTESDTTGASIGTDSVGDVYGVNPIDYGWYAGVSIDIPLGNSAGLVIGAQYQMDLANALNSSNQTASPTSSFKYSDIIGMVGIRFGGMHMK
jgi:hypothetical protein